MGTGFGTRGGCTQGCVERKNLRPPSAAKIFSHQGVKIFFLRGVLLVDRGVILQKNGKK